VARSVAVVARTSGFVLTLWFAALVIELGVLAIAIAGFDEVSQASPFGRTGTVLAAFVIVVVVLIGTIAAWRGVSGALRGVVAALVFAAAGVIAVLALFLVIAGGAPLVLAVLLAHATFSAAMIGRAVLRSTSTGVER